ncbi:MAG: efflux RND transporter periplasmic adaptor subunit [Gammaproteobacteria bacterium]|nr:efflux RND transporter periplasmic adaptor subunit [Gammaproteobacteria bacterium]MCZ6855199.1 efflux RND transporter periplasmic adaptor subunit [Gammaproteobacteria bacterium]
MMRKLLLPSLVVLAAIFGAVTLVATSPALQPTAVEPIPTAVRVRTVVPQPVQLTVHSQGTVVPNTESELIPEVSGRVVWMSPSLVNGGYFESGAVLLRLEDNDYRTLLERSRANLKRAEAEFEHARFEYQRLKQLEDRQLASRSQIENQLRAYRVQEASLQDARAGFAQANRDLARTEIKAPFAGLVREESVDIGQFVSRGASIATIYAGDRAEIRLPIADRQLAFLNLPLRHRGELPLELQPNVKLVANYAGLKLTWHGKIVRLEAQIDIASRMVHVIARVSNDAQEIPLSVGLFVNAEIEGLLVEDIVVLPRNALRNGDRVLIVDNDNKLRYRDIDKLRLYRDDVLIRGGLEAGERVCISPLQTAIDGMPVDPLPENADAVAG